MDTPRQSRSAHPQLRQWVVDQLRSRILDGKLRPGEWLRQERIARELGVSHTPIREALKELVAEGLLEHEPYRGVRVVQFSIEYVEDLYRARAALEGMAARAAATAMSADEIGELRAIFERMRRRLGPRHITEYRELNRRFHTLVINGSRRTFLIKLLGQLWSAFPSMLWSNFARTASAPIPGRADTDVPEHEAIVRALEARDEDAAERAVQHHIQQALHHILGVAAPRQEPASTMPAA